MSSRKRKLTRSNSVTESVTSDSTPGTRHSKRKFPHLNEEQQELSPRRTSPRKMAAGYHINSSPRVKLKKSVVIEKLIKDLTDGPTPRTLIQTVVGEAVPESPVVGTDLTEKLVHKEENLENMSLENTRTIPDNLSIDQSLGDSLLEPPRRPTRQYTKNLKSMQGQMKTLVNVNKGLAQSDQPTITDSDKTDGQEKMEKISAITKITFESPTEEVVPQQPRRQSNNTLLRKKAMLKNLTANGADDPTPRSLIQNVIVHVPVETPVVGEERADSTQHVQVTPSIVSEKLQITSEIEESPLEDVSQQHGNHTREKAAFLTDKRNANIDVAEFAAGVTQHLNDSGQSRERINQHYDTQNLATDHLQDKLVRSDSGTSDDQKAEKYLGLNEEKTEQVNEKDMEGHVDATTVMDAKTSMSNISGKKVLEEEEVHGNEVLSENEKYGYEEKASHTTRRELKELLVQSRANLNQDEESEEEMQLENEESGGAEKSSHTSKRLSMEGDMETVSEKSMGKSHQMASAITVNSDVVFNDEYSQENITADGSKGQRTATERSLDNTMEMDNMQVEKSGKTNEALFSDSDDSKQDSDDAEAGDELPKDRFKQLKITDLLNSPALLADDPPKHNEVSFNELIQARCFISTQQEQPEKQSTAPTQAKKKAPVRTTKPKSKKSDTLRMPRALTKSIFLHFCKSKRITAEVLDEVEKVSDKFWSNIASDLSAYTKHAKRSTVTEEDMKLLMRRQGFVTKKQPMFSLIEEYLPLEYRQELIPIARSGNVVVPNIKSTK